MTIKSAPYYWVECEGCGVKSTEDTDYTAFSCVTGALEDAQVQAWHLAENTESTGNFGHYCDKCTPPWCLECDRPITGDNPRMVDADGDPDNWECKGCAE